MVSGYTGSTIIHHTGQSAIDSHQLIKGAIEPRGQGGRVGVWDIYVIILSHRPSSILGFSQLRASSG